ncbi:cat eye syndrome critical region protein 6-like protein [Plakobranchus ocellatus]|uniref:Cat eye syndrome critical region protein 6-like protein n=1 Tax=Plakobranchus ocellatus TaxID=259542 RepID=A0AAV4D4R8_9GAST|nr:cat eye syndrome critical region protein 6-like protein [Plakobranchus ocellatus]
MSSSICMYSVRLCTALRDWPAAVLCLALSLLQMALLDYYLIEHLGTSHLTWLAFDAINLTLLGITIYQARSAIHQDGKRTDFSTIHSGTMGWVAWLCMSISVAAKAVVIFFNFSDDLDEEAATFFGPNTLKTAIALGSATFLLLLITQHDAPAGSDGRRYIEELTGTVVFDILDTVDILEVLFDSDDRDKLWSGLQEFIMAVAVLNLVLPTVPLLTLARSKFGQKKLSIRLVHGHRILLVLAVNFPNLLVRMMLWHGNSTGISPFMLKNILAISLTFYDIYEHYKERHEEEEGSEHEINDNGDGGKKPKGPDSDFAYTNHSPVAGDSGLSSPGTNKNVLPLAEVWPDPFRHNGGRDPHGGGYRDQEARGKPFEDSDRVSNESDSSETMRRRDKYPPKSKPDYNVSSV